MSETETVSLLVDAGQAKPSGAIAPALGPLGLNLMKVVGDINKATADFEGMKVPVKVIVDTAKRTYKIEVGLPPMSALILREAGVPKGSGRAPIDVVANITMEQVASIAKAKSPDLLAASHKAASKEVLGTMVSMGITVEGDHPKVATEKVNEGVYDSVFDEKNFNN